MTEMYQIPHRQLVMLLLVTVVTVAACGQKGPLYMPDDVPDEKQDEQQQHNQQKQQKS